MVLSRRAMLRGLVATAGWAGCAPRRVTVPVFDADPFSLGVASGYPTPDGVSLWTRLAPVPLAPGGGLDPYPVQVALEVAEDHTFRKLAHRATLTALPDLAHSVHADVTGLDADRWYHYRFAVGDAVSAIGRTRTAPALDAEVARLRFAIGSCQHLEHG